MKLDVGFLMWAQQYRSITTYSFSLVGMGVYLCFERRIGSTIATIAAAGTVYRESLKSRSQLTTSHTDTERNVVCNTFFTAWARVSLSKKKKNLKKDKSRNEFQQLSV